MKWEGEIPSKEIIEKNKELLAKYPFMEIRNIFSDEGWDGEAKYYSTAWNDWENTGWVDIYRTFLLKLAQEWEKLGEASQKAFRIYDTKEKYGKLRVSVSRENSAILDLQTVLSLTSSFTCMQCGAQPRDAKGNRVIWRSAGYIIPFCKECAKKDYLRFKQSKKPFAKLYSKYTYKGPWTVDSYNCEEIVTRTLPNLEDF